MTFFKTLRKDTRGATAIEYGLIAAGIAVVIAIAVYALGDELRTLFENVTGTLHDAQSGKGK